ncbi:hypothetical protein AFERRI_400405 [Acidithiobacillus ferrivorans]|uniref:Uncharacterized protein n=1 Tax=Acidithiobacillus ferrivorans TaxID=160808 RepID=A0A060UVP2_9PROT|nr:hypothetical protein AFERRI_400405 [Acidithiobacillus ferrivorans]
MRMSKMNQRFGVFAQLHGNHRGANRATGGYGHLLGEHHRQLPFRLGRVRLMPHHCPCATLTGNSHHRRAKSCGRP